MIIMISNMSRNHERVQVRFIAKFLIFVVMLQEIGQIAAKHWVEFFGSGTEGLLLLPGMPWLASFYP